MSEERLERMIESVNNRVSATQVKIGDLRDQMQRVSENTLDLANTVNTMNERLQKAINHIRELEHRIADLETQRYRDIQAKLRGF